jgi:hypothetical protein
MNLRDKILAANDIQTELVEVPEWDTIVEVRGMSGHDRARILQAAADSEGSISIGRLYAETVIAATYDPDTGERVFRDEDMDVLLSKAAAPMDRLASVGMRLARMEAGAGEAAKKQFPEEPQPPIPV